MNRPLSSPAHIRGIFSHIKYANAKKFYCDLGKQKIEVNEPPNIIEQPEGSIIDGFANFWIKNFTSIQSDLAYAYNDIAKNPEKHPDWLTEAWIDYRKAFDSVPQSWIKESLKICKVCPVTIRHISESMNTWKTTLNLHHANGSLTSRLINIKSGIFQGGALSPLLFCTALAPLSNLPNNSNYGYKTENGNLNHLFYMDDF
ncbi:uncharacterized protein LOC119598432 [Penaeus monodon]|uniref:uncharacterized protein LOC119598430 n=1 Tax=Penaeus monodon TaxID=6687 RepID=UPI0018A7D2EF|nr:uncharacterized protein LOC119598430 [Penaeus monodon]XP_037804000.1 uncharacterized protein LOC119598432 [Penaeus monodon]